MHSHFRIFADGKSALFLLTPKIAWKSETKRERERENLVRKGLMDLMELEVTETHLGGNTVEMPITLINR